jgi:hypothetical protein
MDISQDSNLNILDQISNYNFNKIENQILNYKSILNNQHSLNRTLLSKNSTELKNDLINFLTIRKPLIDKQLKELVSLKEKITTISIINKNLEEKNADLIEFQDSNEMKELSKKLAELSAVQNELNFFLQDMGIL